MRSVEYEIAQRAEKFAQIISADEYRHVVYSIKTGELPEWVNRNRLSSGQTQCGERESGKTNR